MFEITQEIQKQIRRVVIGKDEVVRKVLMAILSRGHRLLRLRSRDGEPAV